MDKITKWQAIYIVFCVTLIIIVVSREDCEGALPIAQREVPTWLGCNRSIDRVAELTRVIDCLVRQQGRWGHSRRAPRYYRPEQLETYAKAILRAARLRQWPAVKVYRSGTVYLQPVDAIVFLTALIKQQSNFVYDAVSQWNRDNKGNRIRVSKKKAWRRPDRRLDYGLAQMNWGTVRRWKPWWKFRDLKDPYKNVALAAMWMSGRARRCAKMTDKTRLKRCNCVRRLVNKGKWWRVRQVCGSQADLIACKCMAAYETLGLPVYTGVTSTWSLVGKVAPNVWECFDYAN